MMLEGPNWHFRNRPASRDLDMLKTARAIRTSRGLKVAFDVEIAGMATAVPGNKLGQAEAARRAKRLFPDLCRL
ncbi:MAG: hypothetical protein WBW37_15750 [Methyloceanibacter sp.]|jgi:hypothetical protein